MPVKRRLRAVGMVLSTAVVLSGLSVTGAVGVARNEMPVVGPSVSADGVEQPPAVMGRWMFETASGSPLVTPDASTSGNAMTLYGGAQVGSGWVDGGVTFDGVDDYGVTSTVPVDTGASFTISAWARTDAVPQQSAALLSVPGKKQSAFTVSYVPGATPNTNAGRWRIAMASTDTRGAAVRSVDHGGFFSSTEWTHVALVYDGSAKHLSLYVNGELEEVRCADDDGDGVQDDPSCTGRVSWADDVESFKSAQPMQLGRAKTGLHTWGQYWPGTVSDVWAFQGTLSSSQIARLSVGMPGVPTEVPGGV